MSEGGGTSKGNWIDVIKHLTAGGIAGAVSRTVVSPLERMKILFQVQATGPAKYTGVWPTLAKIWREEGWIGYFKGNGTNVVRIAPYSAVQFASYEQYKMAAKRISGREELNTYERLITGALAGMTSSISTYPLDVVRTRLAVQAEDKKYNGIWHCTKVIYREEGGLVALYRGLWPSILGVAPYVAINFTVYETIRSYFARLRNGQPTVSEKLFCGAVAGATGQTFTYPFDLVRRRMQVMGMKGSQYVYKSVSDAFVTIVRTEGIRGLFKGMLPNYLKVAPAMSVSFVTYEWANRLLK